jgi:hypothetical protein
VTDDLRITPELEVSNHDKWLNLTKRVNEKFKGSQPSTPSQTQNADSKSVYNGDIHPNYSTATCQNCSKYMKWLGSDPKQ